MYSNYNIVILVKPQIMRDEINTIWNNKYVI
jgi:hypothetical protein